MSGYAIEVLPLGRSHPWYVADHFFKAGGYSCHAKSRRLELLHGRPLL